MPQRRASKVSLVLLLTCLAFTLATTSATHAIPLNIANASFQAPVFTDGNYAFNLSPAAQGMWGWQFSDGSYIYNPPAIDYTGAGAEGVPAGADGSQIAGVFGFGDYAFAQTLAGPDSILGNGDDPLVTVGAVYTITVAVGQRAVGNTFGATWGGYDVQLRAGTGLNQIILGQETDAATPPPGTFITRTIVIETPTVAHPEAIGLPITLHLRKTILSANATTDYDFVRLDASKVSPPLNANFNEAGAVDAADLSLWRANVGAAGINATHNHGNANGDDYVDGADFLLWQRQLGTTPVAAVPEPSTLVLTIALAASLRRRR